MRSVPFTISAMFGFGEYHGLLYDEGDQFHFEFQLKDAIGGIIKTGVKHVKVPVKDIVSVQLVKGWLGTTWAGVKIVIQANSMTSFSKVPGMTHGKVELDVSKANAAQAEAFVNGLYSNESAEK